jgi:high-affinity nickel-transport protein
MASGIVAPLGMVLLGLMLGMRHATDPDHVVAVTTILSRERSFAAAARIGVVWGLGHTVTVLLVGAAIIVFKIAIPARVGLAMELAVAIALVLLGGTAVGARLRRLAIRLTGGPQSTDAITTVHTHIHRHGPTAHRHVHMHSHIEQPDELTAHCGPAPRHDHRAQFDPIAPLKARRRLLRSFGVGLVHGLAGSAAIALVVLSAIPQPLWAVLYLMVFCVGTIIGMMLITVAIATPFIAAAQRVSGLHERLIASSALLSLGFGLFLGYRICVVDHLFGSVALWVPH